jgi:thioredoxin 1
MKLTHAVVASALWFTTSVVHALTIAPYSAAALDAAQKADAPVALHFHAPWCPTCKAQSKTLNDLKADPALNITVLTVDYDTETDLRKQLKVRSQSTLVVYRGAVERARVSGETQAEPLKAALQAAF